MTESVRKYVAGKLQKLEVYISRDVEDVAKRIRVGDYISIKQLPADAGTTFYSDKEAALTLTVLAKSVVKGIPNEG